MKSWITTSRPAFRPDAPSFGLWMTETAVERAVTLWPAAGFADSGLG